MDPTLEADANELLQQALERATAERADWVRRQSAPPAVIALDTGDTVLGAASAEQAVEMADRLYAQAAHPYQINALAALVEARIAQGRLVDAVEPALRMQGILANIGSVPDSTRSFASDVVERVCASLPAPTGLDCSGD